MTTTTMVLEAAVLTINAVDVSEQTREVELSAEIDELDITTFVSAGWKELRGGQKSGGLKGTFLQTFVDDGLDEDLWALFLAGVAVAFTVRADDAAVSVSNPSYSGKVLVKSWTPIKGKPSDLGEVEFDWPTSGAIVRATT